MKDDMKKLEDNYLKAFVDRRNFATTERKLSIAFNKFYRHLTEVHKMSPMDAANYIGKKTIQL